jgi:hypothetical protein
LPDAGTRPEVGDFSFKAEIEQEGFKLAAANEEERFVIAAGDGDAVRESRSARRRRASSSTSGLTATQDGISVDGGGRLSTTISPNTTVGPVTLQTVQLALEPEAKPRASELRFSALGSFGVDIGPLHIQVEQIGATVNLGSSRDGAPSGAKELIPSLLYARDLGFRPPSGLGIRVESDLVSGGGFLFYDRDKEEYAGVLQLDFGRLALTAIGLLTTRLPDGGRGYSFLIIFSLELDPPLQLGPLSPGIGGLFGPRRALTRTRSPRPAQPHARRHPLPAGSSIATRAAPRRPADGLPADADKLSPGRSCASAGAGRRSSRPSSLARVRVGASSRKALMGQLRAAFPPDPTRTSRARSSSSSTSTRSGSGTARPASSRSTQRSSTRTSRSSSSPATRRCG